MLFSYYTSIKFKIYYVGGNHGRVGKKGENEYHVNFDVFMYKYMHTKFDIFKIKDRVDNVQSNFNLLWFDLVSVFKGHKGPVKDTGWLNLLHHGDGIPMHFGIPFYGLARSGAKYDKMLQQHIHYRHLGHFHESSELSNFSGSGWESLAIFKTNVNPEQASIQWAADPNSDVAGIDKGGVAILLDNANYSAANGYLCTIRTQAGSDPMLYLFSIVMFRKSLSPSGKSLGYKKRSEYFFPIA